MSLTKKKLVYIFFTMIASSIILSLFLTYLVQFESLGADSNYFGELFDGSERLSANFTSPSKLTYFGAILGTQFIILLIILMSKSEYRQYLLNRSNSMPLGAHRLSMQDVLDNQNRSKIIDLIIEKPGIHYSQLLRDTLLAPGNLTWHIEILELYKIIKKQVVGKYVVYFPFYLKNPLSDMDIRLQKSTTCMEILEKIQSTPGITQAEIAVLLGKNHKTVRYHLKKLFNAEIITFTKQGRRKLLYATLPLDPPDEPETDFL